eukprot:382347_1
MTSSSQPSIGIDLGTSFCCVSTWINNTVEIISNDIGERTTPSYVSFTDTERLIGTPAKNLAARNPENTIFNITRLIGKTYDDPTVQSDIKQWPFKVIRESKNRPTIEVKYKHTKRKFFPEEILSMLIGYMKQIAEDYHGMQINNAVISVPVYFNTFQRQSVRNAATIVGINVLRMVSSSALASMAYAMEERKYNNDIEKNILVFDLGGGALDVSLSTIDDGVIEIKAVTGYVNLGGKDFDDILVNYCVEQFKNKHKLDCINSKRAMGRLRKQCEKAKHTLSMATNANIDIECFYNDIDFMVTVTRSKFEELCSSYFEQCIQAMENGIFKFKWFNKSEIDDIVLIGGCTRIPKIQQMLKQYFNGKTPSKSINQDEAVAYGAAIQAAILSGNEMGDAGDIMLLDVVSFSLSIGCIDRISHSSHDDSKNNYPNSNVRQNNMHCVSLSGGGHINFKLIESGKNIPCKASDTVTTFDDNQPGVLIDIYEGNGEYTKDNILLGTLELMDIPPCPRGVPQIEVTFDLDANCILTVTVKDKKNWDNSATITIDSNKYGLSEEEINKIKEDANKWKAEDEEKRKTIKARDELENSAYQMRNSVENGNVSNSMSTNQKNTVQNVINEIIDWIDYNPYAKREEYEAKKRELQNIWITVTTDTMVSNKKQNANDQELIKRNELLESQMNDLKSENNLLHTQLNDWMNRCKELEIKLKEYEEKTWSKDDILQWVNAMKLSDQWKTVAINGIKNGQFDGKDLEKMKSGKDIGKLFGINNPMLSSRLWKELKKIK